MRRQSPNRNQWCRHIIKLQPPVQLLISIQRRLRKIGHHVLLRLPFFQQERPSQPDEFVAEMCSQGFPDACDEVVGAGAGFSLNFDDSSGFPFRDEEVGEEGESALGVGEDLLDRGAVHEVDFGYSGVLVDQAAGYVQVEDSLKQWRKKF